MGSKDIQKYLLQTFSYAAIFQYPLTKEEIWKFLIADTKVSKETVIRSVSDHNSLFKKNQFFSFSEDKTFIEKRIDMKKYAEKKYAMTLPMISILSKIPTVLLIGITGSLAMENVAEDDDIDLFFIVQEHSLWFSRFVILVILQICGKRRKRGQKHAPNLFCINMLVDTKGLSLSAKKQNLYTAHEVTQMKPLFERHGMYKTFLAANSWVTKFLPNSLKGINTKTKNKQDVFGNFLVIPLEWFAKKLQLWYMKKQGVEEGVTEHALTFFPADYGEKILALYKRKISYYKKYETI